MLACDYTKLPRLYVEQDLQGSVTLNPDQTRYLRTVLRKKEGDAVRLFNGRDGEWLGLLEGSGKRDAVLRLTGKIADQPVTGPQTHLVFALIKKQRLDWLVEKAVELGATHLHPVLTQNTDVRQLNASRLRQQVIEATEQCGRMCLPVISDLASLHDVLARWPPGLTMLACLERTDAPLLGSRYMKADKDVAFLIGPEGGFTAGEKKSIADRPFVTSVSLGEAVLRCDTAAAACLSARLLAQG